MSVQLKPIHEQTIVITGASSGIGLATARLAASKGARLVLAARNEEALTGIVKELEADGVQAIHVTADVGVEEQVQKIADRAVERFGGFDTWINDAGVSIYGRIEEVTTQDHRRLFDTNFWGVVYGSRIAANHLRTHGGALINIGSALSDRAIPIQGMYSASKHAVKGFTDALRMELEEAGAPVSVTLVKPSSINTPYLEHAKNYQDSEPSLPPPAYAPQVVAEAIIHCAHHPERDVTVGAGGRMITASGNQAPRLTDYAMESTIFDMQKSDRPENHPGSDKALYHSTTGGHTQGPYPGHVSRSSIYTSAATHPLYTALIGAGAALTCAAIYRSLAPPRSPNF